eukprot:763612-Hanusia_phi.AAC.20
MLHLLLSIYHLSSNISASRLQPQASSLWPPASSRPASTAQRSARRGVPCGSAYPRVMSMNGRSLRDERGKKHRKFLGARKRRSTGHRLSQMMISIILGDLAHDDGFADVLPPLERSNGL